MKAVVYENGCGVYKAWITNASNLREAILEGMPNAVDFVDELLKQQPDPDTSWNLIGGDGVRYRYGDEGYSYVPIPEMPASCDSIVVIDTDSDWNCVTFCTSNEVRKVADEILKKPELEEARKRYVIRNGGELNIATAWESGKVKVFSTIGEMLEVTPFNIRFLW
jgi:hypothetical protein